MGSIGRFVFENAKQAEARFLSHLCVSETGKDSKWVNGADFYYEPHYTWWGLIEQRKRWFNGTTGSFIYLMWLEKDTPISSSLAPVPKRYRSQERQCCRKFLWNKELWASIAAFLGPGSWTGIHVPGPQDVGRVPQGNIPNDLHRMRQRN